MTPCEIASNLAVSRAEPGILGPVDALVDDLLEAHALVRDVVRLLLVDCVQKVQDQDYFVHVRAHGDNVQTMSHYELNAVEMQVSSRHHMSVCNIWGRCHFRQNQSHAALTTVAITVAAVVLVVLEGDEREHLHNHAIQHVWRRKLIRFEWTMIDVMLHPDSMWVYSSSALDCCMAVCALSV